MIPVPELDTIAFDELVAQGGALIPRYAPDWTDHNLHDPGITLLELLAWVVDQQVYRVGFVGDSHLEAFAALLGVHAQPAKPATGLLWPPADAPAVEQTLPAGTNTWPVTRPELIFTTAGDLRLTAAAIDSRWASVGGTAVRVKPDGTGTIRLDPATDSLELRLEGPLFEAGAAERTLALGLEFPGALPVPAPDTPVPVAFDYRAGDGIWHRAASRWIDGDARRSGVALIEIADGHDGVSAIRLSFTGIAFPVRALPTRAALNVLPLRQIETLPALELGEALGLPDLELPLGAGALPAQDGLANPLQIRTLEAGAAVEWRRVGDLAASGPGDSDYVLDARLGVIRFGNGVNGRAPPAGHQIDRGALDVTSGASGNLAAGVAWSIQGLGAASQGWTNREPMAGGGDAWDREALLAEVRWRSRRRLAMLTDAELLDAAARLEGFGLERAEVLPRFLPTLPHRPVPGARTLLLHPASGCEAGDAWVDAIERRLAPGRVLGERLSLLAAEPVTIAVAAELLIASGSDAPVIEKAARTALQARLSPSRTSQEIEPWPSGRPVTIGELEALIAEIDDVVAVPWLRVGGRGEPPEEVSVPLARSEVATAGRIELTLRVEE